MSFQGFPTDGISFLRELRDNNNKPWFEAHKQTYRVELQTPALALVEALGQQLQARFPEVTYDMRANGSGSLMRMYRDVRFSADKSPYKTNIAMMFSSGGKKMESPGFGLQITPDQIDLVAGIFNFSPPLLAAYREAVLGQQSGSALEQAAAQVQAYELGRETYKRVPAGFAADHPRARWLKFTGLVVFGKLDLSLAQTPELVDAAMTHFVAMSPIYRWLREHVV